jgi:hypothetical protein
VVFRCRRLGGLRLGGGAAGLGALDSFLFGAATAADVWLHREYNLIGLCDLQ